MCHMFTKRSHGARRTPGTAAIYFQGITEMTMRKHKSPQISQLSAALAFALLAIAGVAHAQTAPQSEEQDAKAKTTTSSTTQSGSLDTVTVTGSRIKRSQVEGPSPVTVISAEQINREGFNTVSDVLQSLTQNTGSAQNDFNANGGFTPNAAVVNLRGMGPGRTLLLINGRRANDYPFPYNGRSNFQNLNSIPAAAVERVETLAGGASAIYGSDAVAGVINVILKKNYEGDVLKLKLQTTTRGGRDVGDLQWVGGKASDNWSLTYAFESYNAQPLFGYERDFMDSAEDNPAPPGTFPLASGNGVGGYQPPIGAQIRQVASNGTTVRYVQPTGRTCNIPGFRPWTYTSSATGATLGPGCGYDAYPAQATLANGNNAVSAYLYGTYRLTDNLEAWSSIMGYRSRAKLSGGVEQWFGGPQPNGTYYDPQLGIRAFPIRVIEPAAYGDNGIFQRFDERSWDFAIGLRGSLADRFDWEATLSKAKYHAIRDRPRMTVSGATQYFLGTRLGTTTATTAPGVAAGLPIYQLNLDRFYGPISPADYAAMSTMVHYDGESDNAAASFTISGDLFDLPAGPVGFAGVIEASRQSYDLQSDRRIFPDVREIYNLTGTGGGGKRARYATGVEFSIPLSSMLTASVAGRYDKYDDITDVNDARTWGLGLEFRPFSSFLLRGNLSSSFKAPDMHYVFSERSGSFGTITDYYRCFQEGINPSAAVCGGSGARYNYSAFTTSQGQPTLREETGRSATVGFVWDLTEGLSASLDWYRIDLNDVVSVQSGASILEAELGCNTGRYPNGQPYPFAAGSEFCNATLPRITRDATGAITEIRSGPINLAYLGTKGLDGSLRYRFNTERFGNFSTSILWSHVLSQKDRATPASASRDYRDLNANADFRSRVRATVSWNKDSWDSTVYMNRLGSFPIWQPSVATAYGYDSRIAPFITWNISVGKKFGERFSARVNVINAFDNIHPNDRTMNSYPYFWSSYDALGRQVGLELTYKLN